MHLHWPLRAPPRREKAHSFCMLGPKDNSYCSRSRAQAAVGGRCCQERFSVPRVFSKVDTLIVLHNLHRWWVPHLTFRGRRASSTAGSCPKHDGVAYGDSRSISSRSTWLGYCSLVEPACTNSPYLQTDRAFTTGNKG